MFMLIFIWYLSVSHTIIAVPAAVSDSAQKTITRSETVDMVIPNLSSNSVQLSGKQQNVQRYIWPCSKKSISMVYWYCWTFHWTLVEYDAELLPSITDCEDITEFFEKIFNDAIVNKIVAYTNFRIAKTEEKITTNELKKHLLVY